MFVYPNFHVEDKKKTIYKKQSKAKYELTYI